MTKYSKDCRICRAEQETEIQQLKKELVKITEFNQVWQTSCAVCSIQKAKLEKQVEAAKTIISQWCKECTKDNFGCPTTEGTDCIFPELKKVLNPCSSQENGLSLKYQKEGEKP